MTEHKGDGSFDADELKRLAARYEEERADMDEQRTDLSNIMQEVEKKGFNKWAFKTAIQLKNMESTKALDRVRGLENYLHVFGVTDQLDMFENPKEQDNVVPMAGKEEATPAPDPEPATAEEDDAIGAAEELGRKACREGVKATDNPFDEEDGELRSAWLQGYNDEFDQGNAGKSAA